MTERHLGTTPGRDGGEPTPSDLAASDAFLEALSQGEDPSAGSDPLAAALLSLRAEAYTPGHGAPRLTHTSATHNPQCEQFPAISGIHATGPATPPQNTAATPPRDTHPVDELAQRRARHRRGTGSGWLGHGLIGAAAATLVIAGSGAVIHAAQPGDALWGIHEAVFSDHAAVVKLASTLEQADNANANGDVQGALQLLEKARAMAQDMNRQQSHPVEQTPTVTQSVTVTTVSQQPTTVTITPTDQPTATPANTPPAPTTTHTVVVTVTTTHVTTAPVPSAVNLAPGVRPTTHSVKLSELMPPTTATEPTTPPARQQHTTPHPETPHTTTGAHDN